MRQLQIARTTLATALALALAACGGGGSGVRADGPAPGPSDPTTPTTEIQQPKIDDHLTLTNAKAAQQLGYTGKGYRIGVVDTGVNRNHPALQGRVVANEAFVDPKTNNLTVDDVDGHGTIVAQLAAGTAVNRWPGGIATGAEIVSARIISDESPEDDGSGDGNAVEGALGLQPIHDYLIDQGVRIMNNSWGGVYWTDNRATAEIAAEYNSFVFDNDGLVVFATGNEGKLQPTDTAALPSMSGPSGTLPAADLERGWLAVAALDTANPTQLASYSNACGVAMNYCLVAPGTALFTGPDDTAESTSYLYGAGTSFAAPLVSGAAALVWEAFPYFNNDLVRQTLLGTAEDLGDAGVDATFGYGLLDVGKAVLGPAQFNWGDVEVSFDNTTSTWSNAISGDGGLIKKGTGTLVLASSDNSYAGQTQVLAGTLQSASLAGGAAIANGGTLIASNRIGGNLDNAGTLQLGEGELVLSGDYMQSETAQLALNVGDKLTVNGRAEIDGDLQVLGRRDYVGFSRSYTVLQANDGLRGRFDDLTWGAGVFLGQGELSYDKNSAYVTLYRLDMVSAAASLSGVTTTSLSSASRVEKAFQQIDVQQQQGGSEIDGGFVSAAAALQQSSNDKQALASLQSLSGQTHAEAATATFDAVDLGRRALSQHFGKVAGSTTRGSWHQSLGGNGQGSFAGLGNGALSGWMAGLDFASPSGSVFGFAFSEARVNDVSSSDSRDRNRQMQALAYWGMRGENLYALGQLSSGQVDRQIERQLQFGQSRAETSVDYDARFFSSSFEVGYHWRHQTLGLIPYLGLDHVRIESDGFSEQGGEGFGLRADANNASRTQMLMGLRAEYQWRGLTLAGYSEWQQTLATAGLTQQLSFVGADAWEAQDNLQPSRSGGLFGLSLQAPLGKLGALSLGYDMRYGARGDDRAVGMRYLLGF